jgi:hypothetical protein
LNEFLCRDEKKIVKTGKHGKRFKTRKFKNAKKGSAVEYSQSFVKYWIGTYEDLEEQKLKIEVHMRMHAHSYT